MLQRLISTPAWRCRSPGGEGGLGIVTKPLNRSLLPGLIAFSWVLGVGAGPADALPVSFQLTSSSGGSNLPFTLGQVFAQGEVPSGSNVVGSIGSLQAIPKNRWPDGSLKYAIISGRMTLGANSPGTVTLNLGAGGSGSALTTGDLRATNVTASIGAGSYGTVSWSGADWDSPFLTWVNGPEMSSWVYRKPIGSDPHLVGWLEVRLYAGGAVEVLPWIENGYLLVASPTSKSATYSFTLGGTQRFSQGINLLNHQRAVLASGTTFSHWLGTDPQVIPKHDVAYLQASKVVPAYAAVISSGSPLWSRLVQTYTPLAQANYPTAMGSGGYHLSIGPIPEWDVAYLTSDADPRAYRGVIVHGYCAGRFGIHFRDETTNRPPRFTSHLTLVLDGSSGLFDTGASSTNSYTPTASGGAPPQWPTSHHPSVGYMAYLVTGHFYFMEETEFSATVCFFKQNDQNRQGAKGILLTNAGANTTRGAAWSLRTLAQAASITPDSDPLHGDYATSIEENVNFYHGKYVAQPNHPQGVCAPYSNYNMPNDPFTHASWMEDFLTFSFGYIKDLAVVTTPTVITKLGAFLTWKYQSVVGRFGGSGSTEYCYRDAGLYNIAVAPSNNSSWDTGAGPWYNNWGEMYVATVGHANDCAAGTTLRGTSGADPLDMSVGYWGNLRPALCYAVDHGAAGAATAYARLTGASNYAAGAAKFNDDPVWSIRPHNPSGATDTAPPQATSDLRPR